MKKNNSLLLFISFFLLSSPAFAQLFGQKMQTELGGFGGYVWPGDYPIEPKDAFLGGLRLGFWMTNSFSAEVSGQRAFSEDITGGSRINLDAYRFNLLWNFIPGHRLRPFITLGAGVEGFDFGATGKDYPIGYNGGAGLRIFVGDYTGFRAEGRYVYVNADFLPQGDYVHNIEAQLGFFYLFGKHKKKEGPAPAPTPAAPMDTDGDGVSDEKDQCSGTAVGIKVNELGCELDSDADGVLDSKDKCENTPTGTMVDETGCPPEVVKKTRGALKGVNFVFGKTALTEYSKKILNEVAAALKEITDGKVEVQGHTDNIGSTDANLKISQARAESVVEYLISQGVDEKQLTWRGYGESMPVADNKTDSGRAQNRRVELKWLE